MKVLLIDVDSKMPNRALMVISAYHKSIGNQVYFRSNCNPDEVYISCLFTWNRAKALGIAKMYPDANIHIGGSGVNFDSLPDCIEHMRPDYSLYGIDYSVGFTSRGCIRNCPWCIVPRKEGSIRDNAPIDEFLHPSHKKLILLDGNFLASPKWDENLREITARKIKVSFNQGLDIRLIDRENARLLKKTLYYDDQFKRRRLYFSFDLPQLEHQVLEGINILKNAGIPPRHLMFYVLVGYNTDYDQDFHRINLLLKEGVLPYVMVFNNRRDSYYPHLKRWMNHRYYRMTSWEKYDHGNSQEIIKNFV